DGRGAAVGQDLHVAIRHQYIDEYAVAEFGVPDAELAEHVERTRPRRVAARRGDRVQRGFDHEADLAAGARLGRADRRLDGGIHGVGEAPASAPARCDQVTEKTADIHRLTTR